MTQKDRDFLKSLPLYPMEYVGKLPDATTTKLDEFELKDKQGNLVKFKKLVHKFDDYGIMGYWIKYENK